MKKILLIVSICLAFCFGNTKAQINLNDLKNLKITDLLGKTLEVKKGWAPKFSLNNQNLNKINQVAQIFKVKNNPSALKLFNTFKTGTRVYRALEYVGAGISLYGAVKSIDKATLKKDYQNAFKAAVGSALTGVIVKLATKGAAEKAKNEFNRIIKDKIKDKVKDIIGLGAASNGMGIGVYVKLN